MNSIKLKKQLRPADYRPGTVTVTRRPQGLVWNTKTRRLETLAGGPVTSRDVAMVRAAQRALSRAPADAAPAPKPLGYQLWTVLRSRATELGERNDCSVIGVAAACGVSYERAHDACRKHGRVTGRGMYNPDIIRAVQSLGYDLVDMTSLTRRSGGRTVRTAGRLLQRVNHEASTTGYLVFTRGHVAGFNVSIGHIIDWTAERQHRVVGVYRINKRG